MNKKSWSLRGRLFTLMAVIAIVECVVLVLTVALSGAFRELDSEAFRYFSNDSLDRAKLIDNATERLIQNATVTASSISANAQELAAGAHEPLGDAYRIDELYRSIAERCSKNLLDFLNGNAVSAAFFILTGSNTNKEDAGAHSAVYIRNSAPGITNDKSDSLQLEVGPISVARENRIATGASWALDMMIDTDDDGQYYCNPIEACETHPNSELVRYGYWSPPTVILPGTQECISYTLPLLSEEGLPWGVFGFEVTVSYFTQEYISRMSLPYPESFFAITSGRNDELDMSWVMPGSPAAATSLPLGETIKLKPVDGSGLYETSLGDLGSMYCTLNELTMYSRNSPFAEELWLLVGMVPRSVLNETSTRLAAMMITNMAIMLAVAFIAIFALTFLSSRKIVGLSQHINSLGPGSHISFEKTGLREIDDLMSAIERLNRRINDNLKVTSKMMELTQLPLGGFEVSDDLDQVLLTEYIYSLLHLPQGERIGKEEWKQLYGQLTAHPADGYPNVYRYDVQSVLAMHMSQCGHESVHSANAQRTADGMPDMYQYTYGPSERQKWLRIIEVRAGSGTVGMILDCTSDMDQMMRLAHDLDYDALTHLYNRSAFKREAFKRVKSDPSKIGAMIFSDLDNLKHTNDTYGHLMGDRLIMTAADMFRRFVDYGGIVARISGDEFAIFLYGFDSRREVMKIITRLYSGYRNVYFLTQDGEKQWMSCSSGIAWYPKDSTDVSDLLKLSDYAMYEAKRTRKGSLYEKEGGIMEFGEEAEIDAEEPSQRREDLSLLLKKGNIRFQYQPIVNLHNVQIYGYEALMRPQVGDLHLPTEVLAAARMESMLDDLEGVLVWNVLGDVELNQKILKKTKIFINSISGQHLRESEWNKIRKRYANILPDIIFEVTENENDNIETMLAKLHRLRKAGVSIAIDNFGHGYSNEVRVMAMRPFCVKIDTEVFRNAAHDTEKRASLDQLISFVHAKGVKVVAEGVEQQQELATAIRLGADFAQGFLLGKPEYEFRPLSEPVVRLLEEETSH